MAKVVELIGVITKVTRTSGKEVAQVSLTIPANKASALPMGEVNITVEPTQSSMFDK